MRYKTTDRHIHVLYLQINDVFCFDFVFLLAEGRKGIDYLTYLCTSYVAEPYLYGNVSRLLSLMQV